MTKRKKLIENFLSLGVQQGILVIFPLLFIPYLLKVLGVAGMGTFTVLQTVLLYFDLVIIFGFSITATKRISHANGILETQQQIAAAVYMVKGGLYIISLLLLLPVLFFLPINGAQRMLFFFICMLHLLGTALYPDWFFQGIQKMRSITIITLLSKVAALTITFIFIKDATQILWAIGAVAIGNFIAGITGFFILFKKIEYKLLWQPLHYCMLLFKESVAVFISIILVPLYSSVNIFILQYFYGALEVGYYAIAYKIFNAAAMLASVSDRVFFPHLATLYKNSLAGYKKEVRKISTLIAAFFITFSFFLFLFAKDILQLIANPQDDILHAVYLLKILCLALVFSPFISFFFQQLIIQNEQKRALKNVLIAIGVNLVLATTFSYFWAGTGTAICTVVVLFVMAFQNARSAGAFLKFE